MKSKILCFAAAILSAAALTAQANPPLKNVVLYSSGVGMFVHGAAVENDQTVTLTLSEAQLNDALKSLLVLAGPDLRVKTIKYDGKDTLAQQFLDTQIKLDGKTDLKSLLTSLKGCPFDIETNGNMKYKNWRYIGCTEVATAPELKECMLNFLENDQIRSLQLSQIKTITPSDPTVRANLRKALELLEKLKDTSRKQLRIQVEANKKQEMNLAYIIAAPVWKPSYRLILPEQGDKSQVMLQMWAIVENPTSEPWNNIKLSLVSGKPVSFVQDLYTTLYKNRPVLKNEEGTAPRPRPHAVRATKSYSTAARGAVVENAAMEEDGLAVASVEEALATDSTEKIGSFCRYELKKAVSLQGREAAMLPLDTLTLDAEVVTLYRQGLKPQHAILLKNNSDLLLPAGPVTLYSSKNTYAGDASLKDVVAGAEQMLTYGFDLEVEVEVKNPESQGEKYLNLKKVKGSDLLTWDSRCQQKYTVSVKNKSKENKTLVLHLPKWIDSFSELAPETIKPIDEKNGCYHFKFTVAPNATRNETITEFYLNRNITKNARTVIEQFDAGDPNWERCPQAGLDFFKNAKKIIAEIKKLQTANNNINRKEKDLRAAHARANESYNNLKHNADFSASLAQRVTQLDQQLFALFIEREKNYAEIEKLEKDLKKMISEAAF